MSSEHSASRQNAPAIFHRADALARAGDDQEIAQVVARMFLEHGPEWLDQLRQAIASSDWPTAQRIAHTLKSSADNLGCHETRATAWSIESAVAANEYDSLEPLIAKLDEALQRCLPQLTEFCEAGENPS